MGKPAARIGDMHVRPGGGGPIVEGCVTVIIAGMPAARTGDKAVCAPGMDVVGPGAPGVIIGGKMAARMGDSHACGGKIVSGCPTVIIGDKVGGAGAAPVTVKLAQQFSQQVDLADFIGMDPATGRAIENLPYEFRDKKGNVLLSGVTDHVGDTARVFTESAMDLYLYVGEGEWSLSMDGMHESGEDDK
ncbi:PAAR domain-containing protein [Massilia sp. W12]|uniref:PAAR domain-containing protein n=1 Tax=Massilia sp. W12 TaxID=3126507 RepID=UPI0030CEFD0A